MASLYDKLSEVELEKQLDDPTLSAKKRAEITDALEKKQTLSQIIDKPAEVTARPVEKNSIGLPILPVGTQVTSGTKIPGGVKTAAPDAAAKPKTKKQEVTPPLEPMKTEIPAESTKVEDPVKGLVASGKLAPDVTDEDRDAMFKKELDAVGKEPARDEKAHADFIRRRNDVVKLYEENKNRMEWAELAQMLARGLGAAVAARVGAAQASREIAESPLTNWESKYDRLMKERQMSTSDIEEESKLLTAAEKEAYNNWWDKIQAGTRRAESKISDKISAYERSQDRAQQIQLHNARILRDAQEAAQREKKMDERLNTQERKAKVDALRTELGTLKDDLSKIAQANSKQGSTEFKRLGLAALTPAEQKAYDEGHGFWSTDKGELEQMLKSKAAEINAKRQGIVARIKAMGGEVGGEEVAPVSGRSVKSKMYSPSRNQTRIIYSDGTEEVIDGKRD